jgi:hypothetical protein
MPRPLRSESGQASVELVALLPLVVVLCALLWQAVVAGQAIWLSGTAARAAARAAALGADAERSARGALPAALRHGLEVQEDGDDGVRVRIAVPLVLGGGSVATVTGRAQLPRQT